MLHLKRPRENKVVNGKAQQTLAIPQHNEYYTTSNVLIERVHLHAADVDDNVKATLLKEIRFRMEGKCTVDGYIRPGSVVIQSYSCGSLLMGKIEFQVLYMCDVCLPVQGEKVSCKIKSISKAGVHAECVDVYGNVPMVVFLPRDYNYRNADFSELKEKDVIRASIIGTRFELNQTQICTLGEWIKNEGDVAEII